MIALADPVVLLERAGDTRDVGEMVGVGPAAAVAEDHVVLVAVGSGSLQQLAEGLRTVLVHLHRFAEHFLLGELEGAARGEQSGRSLLEGEQGRGVAGHGSELLAARSGERERGGL